MIKGYVYLISIFSSNIKQKHSWVKLVVVLAKVYRRCELIELDSEKKDFRLILNFSILFLTNIPFLLYLIVVILICFRLLFFFICYDIKLQEVQLYSIIFIFIDFIHLYKVI